MLSKTTIITLREQISKIIDIQLCYIFGSAIKSQQFNDIDVGIVVSNPQSSYQDLKLAMSVARELEKKLKFRWEFDVKVLNHAPIYFQFEVVKQGLLLYCRNETERISYEENVINSYLDFRDTLDWFNIQVLRSA